LNLIICDVLNMIFYIILKKEDDGWIVAECPALPGCVSQGKDEKKALDNIKEAIVLWLWAEDQKAFINLEGELKKEQIIVTV